MRAREKVCRGRGKINRQTQLRRHVREMCFSVFRHDGELQHVVKACVPQRTRTKRREERKGEERISDRSKPPKPVTQRRDCAV